jgi:co-chaperonin GroES (HSP10)
MNKDLFKKYTPLGNRILIKVNSPPTNTKTESGIELVYTKEIHRLDSARESGKVIALGDQAFKNLFDSTPWIKIGDTVVYERYSGKEVVEEDPETGEIIRLRFIEDISIFAKVNFGDCPFFDLVPGLDSKSFHDPDKIADNMRQEQAQRMQWEYEQKMMRRDSPKSRSMFTMSK